MSGAPCLSLHGSSHRSRLSASGLSSCSCDGGRPQSLGVRRESTVAARLQSSSPMYSSRSPSPSKFAASLAAVGPVDRRGARRRRSCRACRCISNLGTQLLSNTSSHQGTGLSHARYLSARSPSGVWLGDFHLVWCSGRIRFGRGIGGGRNGPGGRLRLSHSRGGAHARTIVRRRVSTIPSTLLAAAAICLLKPGTAFREPTFGAVGADYDRRL